MTVSSETQRLQYTANGSQDTFAYTFRILAEGDVTVYLTDTNDNDTLQVLNTDYTVTNVGATNGGNIVFTTPPTNLYTVTIYRDVSLTQTTEYIENTSFPAESHENALDKLTFISQQIQDELDRSVKVPVTDPIGTTLTVPNINTRKSKYLQFDANGDMTVAEGLEADAVTFENLDANSDVGTGSDQVAVGNHNHSHLNITDIGTKTHTVLESDINNLQYSINTFSSPNSASLDDLRYEINNLTLPTSASDNDVTYAINNLTLPTSASDNDVTYAINNLTLPLSASWADALTISAASYEQDNRIRELIIADYVSKRNADVKTLDVTAGGIVISDADRQFQIAVNSRDLEIGPSTNTDFLKIGSDNNFYITDGSMYIQNPTDGTAFLDIGQSGNHRGSLSVQGDHAGSVQGGIVAVYLADDYDSTVAFYSFQAYQDDFIIGPHHDTDALRYKGDSNHWEFTRPVDFLSSSNVSAAVSEADNRIYEYVDGEIAAIPDALSVSASSVEQDNRLQEQIDTNVTAIGLNTTHRGSDGSDHSIVVTNQSNILSVSGGSVEQDNRLQEQIDTNVTAIGLNTTHRTSNGTDHSYIDQDVTTTGTPSFTSVTSPTTTVAEKLVIPTDEPASLEEGCIWIV